ncbi:MAG: MarR family winged helix-turn-helix transcriptional regulator [Thermoleophilia bacterium]
MSDTERTQLTWNEMRDAARVYIKLVRAAESVSGRVHGELANEGLTVSQFGVLEALFNLGSMCQRDLAAKILKTSGNMTLVIDNLEKKGYVYRERSASDRRFMNIHLTDSGRTFIGSMYTGHLARIMREMEVLSAEERQEFGRLCRKVGIGREEADKPSFAAYERTIRHMVAART